MHLIGTNYETTCFNIEMSWAFLHVKWHFSTYKTAVTHRKTSNYPKLRLFPHVAAVVAFPVMNTNHSAATRAPKPLSLNLQKLIHAFCFEQFEVFHHTHAVAFTVAFVEMGEFFAWHRVAFAAGLNFVVGQFFAAPFDVAVLGSGLATRAVADFATYPRHPMRVSQVAFAYSAVHTAHGATSSAALGRCE